MRSLIVEQLEVCGSSQESILAVFTDDTDPLPEVFVDELNKHYGDSHTVFKVSSYEQPKINPKTIGEFLLR